MSKSKVERIGETKTMKCGLKARVIGYRSTKDIDVRFDNGVVREHVSWGAFVEGNLSPNLNKTRTGKKISVCIDGIEYESITRMCKILGINRHSFEQLRKKKSDQTAVDILRSRQLPARLGKRKKMTSGEYCSIIEYRSCRDIDVKFDNGTVKKHCYMSAFNQGAIRSSKYQFKNDKDAYYMQKCGLSCKYLKSINKRYCEVEWEDGEISIVESGKIRKGLASHPILKANRVTCHFCGYTAKFINSNDGKTYYKTKTPEGDKAIMTPQQMIANRKDNNG